MYFIWDRIQQQKQPTHKIYKEIHKKKIKKTKK